MAHQQAVYTNTTFNEKQEYISIYPPAKREKKEKQEANVEPSAPTLNNLYPHLSSDTIDMFWYLTQTFPELKELYDTYPLRMVLECINIHPAMWNTFNFTRQKEYLDIWFETEEYMKKNNI